MQTLLQDLRYGARMLMKKPGFTLIAVIALALGIGANTAIFSIVNAVLLRPLPYHESERLVAVYEKRTQQESLHNLIAPADFYAWQEQNRSFESLAAYTEAHFNLTEAGEPERFWGLNATRELFSVLGVGPMLGRDFAHVDGQSAASQVAILSYRLWQRRFGSDPNLIGKTIILNESLHTVIGVMPPDFQFPSKKIDIWTVTDASPEARTNRRFHYFTAIGRLKADVTLEQARAEMESVARQLEQHFPDTNAGRGVSLFPLRDEMTGNLRPALLILLGAVGFVLLIACANLTNLQLARAASREKEMVIRAALGAGRWRLIRQLLTESLLLSALGGAAGMLLAAWGVALLDHFIPTSIAEFNPSSIDGRILGFTLAVSLLAGVLAGLLPALQASRHNLSGMLKESAQSVGDSPRHRRVRSALVVSEIALSLVLLVGAGLLIKSFARLLEVQPGFATQNVVAMDFSLDAQQYHQGPRALSFIDSLIEKLTELPGVEAAGITSHLPLSGEEGHRSFRIGRQPIANDEKRDAEYRTVSPDYFRAMGIPLRSGRFFTARDTFDPGAKENPPQVVIVNEAFVRRHLAGQDPLAQRVVIDDGANRVREIIGVVGDVKHFGLDASAVPEMYLTFAQMPRATLTLVVRTTHDPANLVAAVRESVRELDRNLPVYNVKTVADYLSESVAARRLNMLLLSLFAALATILSAIGIYGVMSYGVSQRRHEIGVRMALGAQPGDVLKLVLRQGAMLVLLGVGIGLAAALALVHLLKNLLFGVAAGDPFTFTTITLALIIVAVLACYLPARRATRVDPMVALRYE